MHFNRRYHQSLTQEQVPNRANQ